MANPSWTCPKCNHHDYESSEFRATGGILSKIFDIQTRRFSTVTCSRCSFTEMYRTKQSGLGNVFDFFVGT
ncbi:MAG: zinc ribbon domain-containing protein [Planctomycetota bacterium]|jgi:predicted nucleic-acid-binding Zn-ribbon protein